jgi:hypothetical protein
MEDTKIDAYYYTLPREARRQLNSSSLVQLELLALLMYCITSTCGL